MLYAQLLYLQHSTKDALAALPMPNSIAVHSDFPLSPAEPFPECCCAPSSLRPHIMVSMLNAPHLLIYLNNRSPVGGFAWEG